MVDHNRNIKDEPSYIKRLNLKPDLSKGKYDARTREAMDKYRKLYPDKFTQSQEKVMQQTRWILIDGYDENKTLVLDKTCVESISYTTEEQDSLIYEILTITLHSNKVYKLKVKLAYLDHKDTALWFKFQYILSSLGIAQ